MSRGTRHGDDGNTQQGGGKQVPKDDERIEAYGTIDELNAFVGLARVSPIPPDLDVMLERIQSDLFDLGADLLTPRELEPRPDPPRFPHAALDAVDGFLSDLEERVPPTTSVLLPGGHRGASLLCVCRTVCRRAERRVVTLARHQRVQGTILRYLNRLSDLFFLMARLVNTTSGIPEPEWLPREVREAGDGPG
jgi:cob(I)alamin adenosyltransferase